MGKVSKVSNEPIRKRGRPPGKNRAPLSEEERKARNAKYEKERRNGQSVAMAELAVAAGYESEKMTNTEIVKFVTEFLKQFNELDPAESVDSLRQQNENLLMQIQNCEERLAELNAGIGRSALTSDFDNHEIPERPD